MTNYQLQRIQGVHLPDQNNAFTAKGVVHFSNGLKHSQGNYKDGEKVED